MLLSVVCSKAVVLLLLTHGLLLLLLFVGVPWLVLVLLFSTSVEITLMEKRELVDC